MVKLLLVYLFAQAFSAFSMTAQEVSDFANTCNLATPGSLKVGSQRFPKPLGYDFPASHGLPTYLREILYRQNKDVARDPIAVAAAMAKSSSPEDMFTVLPDGSSLKLSANFDSILAITPDATAVFVARVPVDIDEIIYRERNFLEHASTEELFLRMSGVPIRGRSYFKIRRLIAITPIRFEGEWTSAERLREHAEKHGEEIIKLLRLETRTGQTVEEMYQEHASAHLASEHTRQATFMSVDRYTGVISFTKYNLDTGEKIIFKLDSYGHATILSYHIDPEVQRDFKQWHYQFFARVSEEK